jgi:hypothetical protein
VLADADVDHLVRAFEDVFRVLADRYPHQPKGSR